MNIPKKAEDRVRNFEKKFGVPLSGEKSLLFLPLGFAFSRFPGSATTKWGSALVLCEIAHWFKSPRFIVATVVAACWAIIIYQVWSVYTDYTAKKEAPEDEGANKRSE